VKVIVGTGALQCPLCRGDLRKEYSPDTTGAAVGGVVSKVIWAEMDPTITGLIREIWHRLSLC